MKRSRPSQQQVFAPGLGAAGANAMAQVFVDTQQMTALRNMFERHPTLQAASNVLESQILSSGLTLKLHGERANLTVEFL